MYCYWDLKQWKKQKNKVKKDLALSYVLVDSSNAMKKNVIIRIGFIKMNKKILILALILLIVLNGCSKEIVNVYHIEKECCVPVNNSYVRCCDYQCDDLDCEEDMDNYYFREYLKCCNDILDEI